MRTLFTTLPAALFFSLFAGIAAAHEGHGFSGAHWHASDLFGPAVLLAVGGAALWWGRRK
jgi:hypothetical protein